MLSCVVLTKNEESNIKDCLESVSWCDEIIVIDDFSEDSTVEIAKKLGATVFSRKLNDDFAAQRNFGLEKASSKGRSTSGRKGDWVLFVDADERISKELAEEIRHALPKWENLSGFYLNRRDVMWGRELKYGETNIKLLRIAKTGAGIWKRAVHEYWDIKPKGFDDRIGEFHVGVIEHYPHQTISEFLSDISRYSTLHAQENMKEEKRSSILKILLWPKLKFLQNYVLKLGFLDGGPGLVSALMMSFHSYLAWSKLWLLQKGTTA